jgi:N-acetylmuramoyl-L-alanine amidase
MIYLVAGHSKSDPGAIGVGGVKESELAMELRDKIAHFITSKGYKVTLDNDHNSLSQVIAGIKSTESCVICDIHFNAGPATATGVETIIPDRSTANERMIAGLITSGIASAMGIRSRGVKSEKDTARKTLAIMKLSGINLLPEICFVSNKSDMSAYQANKDKVAEVIARHLITAEDLLK